jgi:hypothetical protein
LTIKKLDEIGVAIEGRMGDRWSRRAGLGCRFDVVYATGWHNGHPSHEAAGYGLKLTKADRDRYFDRTWQEVELQFVSDQSVTTVQLNPSFWGGCTELRSATIGQWLLTAGAAPWSQGNPPGVVVTHVEDNRFTARLIERRVFGR